MSLYAGLLELMGPTGVAAGCMVTAAGLLVLLIGHIKGSRRMRR